MATRLITFYPTFRRALGPSMRFSKDLGKGEIISGPFLDSAQQLRKRWMNTQAGRQAGGLGYSLSGISYASLTKRRRSQL